MDCHIEWKGKGFSFVRNKDCEFFPCHDIGAMDPGSFNCLFCFCPLYGWDGCGGEYVYLENGCKDCSACFIPHRKENYGHIIEKLRRPAARSAEGQNGGDDAI